MHKKEKRLARELKSGSTKALGEVIDDYSGYAAAVIRNFSRVMLTEEDIDELCGDVFFGLWEHRASLDDENGEIQEFTFSLPDDENMDITVVGAAASGENGLDDVTITVNGEEGEIIYGGEINLDQITADGEAMKSIDAE